MKNLAKSEMLVTFQEGRDNFKPYGLTCEKWAVKAMRQFDRHNEIEINFVPDGTLCYSFTDRRMEIPKGKLSLFWGLMPHRVEDTGTASSYYVATIPLSIFLDWELPGDFVRDLVGGGVLVEENNDISALDLIYFQSWINDITYPDSCKILMLEMRSRMLRFASHYACGEDRLRLPATGKIELMAMYIANNYASSLSVGDVGAAAGLNPDYAGNLFKKAFGHTVKEHITMERIARAQRQLLLTTDSILQVCYDCGFSSVSSFNIAFRRLNGCTPRDYRMALRRSEGAFG